MLEALFQDGATATVTVIFGIGMALCAVFIPMTIRRTRELKEENDRKFAKAS